MVYRTPNGKALVITNEDYPDFNAVFAIKCESRRESRSLIEDLAKRIAFSGKRPSVWLDDFCRPTDLPEILTKLGFRQVSTFSILAAKPLEIKPKIRANMTIWQVTDGWRELRAWINIYGLAFGQVDLSYDLIRWKQAFNKQLEENPPLQFYLGFKPLEEQVEFFPGIPVTVGQMIVSHGTGGIYSIGTIPEQRGRGFASEMISNLAIMARLAGLEFTYLTTQNSENSRFFERLGFTEAVRTEIWRPK
ncbi:MAG: GNAT family N-acetyltransferase [bacterium]|nr:GNAT family N-acetyltransferase [bacterium]